MSACLFKSSSIVHPTFDDFVCKVSDFFLHGVRGVIKSIPCNAPAAVDCINCIFVVFFCLKFKDFKKLQKC